MALSEYWLPVELEGFACCKVKERNRGNNNINPCHLHWK